MTSPFSNELISAYLDGELTAEEVARVEKQLREDVELRRMCDELRALRFTLQSMPVAEGPEDLAARVLRQAERQMLLGEEGDAKKGHREEGATEERTRTEQRQEERVASHSAAAADSPMPKAGSSGRNWRFVAGCVAAAAALLLVALMLFDPSNLRSFSRDVAQGTQDSASSRGESADADESAALEAMELAEIEFASDLDDQPSRLAPTPEGIEIDDAGDHSSDALTVEPAPRFRAGRDEQADGERADFGMSDGSEPADRRKRGRPAAPSAPDAQHLGEKGVRPNGSQSGPAPGATRASGGYGGVEEKSFGMGGGMGGMGGGGESGAIPPRPPMKAGEGKEQAWKYEADQLGRAGQGIVTESAGAIVDESRTSLAQRLATKLDQDQELLVHVTVPANLPRELAEYFYRATDPNNTLGLGSATRMQMEAERLVELRALSTESLRQKLPYLVPQGQKPIVIEGSPEDVRRTLVQLVNRSDIQVHNIPASALQPFGDYGATSADRPNLARPDEAKSSAELNAVQPLAKGKVASGEEDSESIRRRFSEPGTSSGYAVDGIGGKAKQGSAGPGRGYGSQAGDGQAPMDESGSKNPPAGDPSSGSEAESSGLRKELLRKIAPTPFNRKSKTTATEDQKAGDSEQDKADESPQSGQRGLDRGIYDEVKREQKPTETEADLAYKRSAQKKDLRRPSMPTQQPQAHTRALVILFRFKTESAAAESAASDSAAGEKANSVQESSKEK